MFAHSDRLLSREGFGPSPQNFVGPHNEAEYILKISNTSKVVNLNTNISLKRLITYKMVMILNERDKNCDL